MTLLSFSDVADSWSSFSFCITYFILDGNPVLFFEIHTCSPFMLCLHVLISVKATCGRHSEWRVWPSSPERWLSGCPPSWPGLTSPRASDLHALGRAATPQTGVVACLDLHLSHASKSQKVANDFWIFFHPKSYIFGAVTVVTGILGGALGTTISRQLRDRFSHADPLICAVGMLGSVPCLFITIFVASSSIPVTYVRGKHFYV